MAPESRRGLAWLLLVLQAAASPPCAKVGVAYEDSDVPDVGPNGAWVLDAQQCQNSCEARATCAYFSFVPSNLPGAGECWLLGKHATAVKRKGVISGPQVCTQEKIKLMSECGPEHQCPAHWRDGPGGFLCLSGTSVGACRKAAHGVFPALDCQVQCRIGIVDPQELDSAEPKERADEAPEKTEFEKEDVEKPKASEESSKSDVHVLTTWLVDSAEPEKTWKPRKLVLPEEPSEEKELGLIQELWKEEIPPSDIFKIHVVRPMVTDYPGTSLHILVEKNPLKKAADLEAVLLQVEEPDSDVVHWQAKILSSPVTFDSLKAKEGDRIVVNNKKLQGEGDLRPGDLIKVEEHAGPMDFSGEWARDHRKRGGFTEDARRSLERSRRRVEIIEKKINKVIGSAVEAPEEVEAPKDDLGSTSFEKVVPCPADVDADCPKDWFTGRIGGYFCPSQSGCRPAEHGAFPSEVCKDQCSIGHVFAGGGGDVAVPFDCWLHLKSWKTHWSPGKKRWCCANSVQGSVACEDDKPRELERCPRSLETSCPKEWHGIHTAAGGFYCHTHNGCRAAAEGPFPLESCKDQCYIGRVTLGGFLPKPVYWDCGLDFSSWDTKWSQEKKRWCCAHYRGAHTVCKATVHKVVHTCDAITAGGVPCNFPFRWSDRSHYGCVAEDHWMGGEPWCIRVDGNVGTCDCEVHVKHVDVTHVHHQGPEVISDGRDFKVVHPCFFEQMKHCPEEWMTSHEGGYFCHLSKGCRPAAHGPFPQEDCKEQCSIGHVFVEGGGDVAVPFDCKLDLHSWHTWSDEKKGWCCRNSQEGQAACEDLGKQPQGLQQCPYGAEAACPTEWHSGGFFCHSHHGCRPADEGPFPLENCEEQCFFGRPALGGFIPKPVFWDCHLDLHSWESHWTKEKKRWCCDHYKGAHVACAVGHADHGCVGTTAGGVPCNFPFRWEGKDHYGCVSNHSWMGGEPWCMRVDGNWAMCDCKAAYEADSEHGEDFWPPADKGDFAGGLMVVTPCPSHLQTGCPSEWIAADAGGFFCHSTKGCREADHGPFPEEDCEAQCSLGEVYIPGGGDVAVPFDCSLHLASWRSRWSHAKRRWCCEHSEEGRVACAAQGGSVSSGHLRKCPRHLSTDCPAEWDDPGARGGWYCIRDGPVAGGCRQAEHGPFPLEDCKEQCYLGDVQIGGSIPKPVLWDCQRHLHHWEHHWSPEKQYWCCTHDHIARQVCAHVSVNHQVVTSCDATTAGGVPCDFPFLWKDERHYSCVVDKPHMGGNPWCVRMDGTWADCDCHGFGSVISVDVNHVHIKYPHVTIGISDKELNWKPEGITEGIKSAFECSKKDVKWTETKKQWCCQLDEDCEAKETAFDCLADLSEWEKAWSLEKKVWCWTQDGAHELFDCAADLEQAESSWSPDKQDWCCRNKHKGCMPFDCHDGLHSWETEWNLTKKKWCWNHEHKGYFHPFQCEGNFKEQTNWPKEKQEWCCKSQHKGCMGNFDCQENYATWQVQWTFEKKHYCCEKEGKGCYDCNAGLRNWERGWSDKKKTYCCNAEKKGCFSCLKVSESPEWKPAHRRYCCSAHNVACHDCNGDVRLFAGKKKEWCCENERRCHPSLVTSTTVVTTNCPDVISSDNPEYCNTPIGTWPPEKLEFCCKHYKRGCPEHEFDCNEDMNNLEWSWSSRQKEWCCVNEHKGCPRLPNCHTAPSSWSHQKRHYCCHHYHVGCAPYECNDGSSPSSWSHSHSSWCCAHEDIGCPIHHPQLVISIPRPVHRPFHALHGCNAICHFAGESHSCGARIKYAAAHRFANNKHACVAAHHLVAGECDHCSDCTVQLSGCYVFWHPGPAHHHVTKHTVTTVVHHHDFRCNDGMLHLWSPEKKHYCCVREGKGCPKAVEAPEKGYNCDLGFDKWEINWDANQQAWCCKHQQKSCARYQCDLDLATFKTSWGPPKKVWCCQHENRGCVPGFTWFDCTEQAEQWEELWTAEKKGWCCSHEKKGCPGWRWHPPPAAGLHVTHTTYVTHHVHHGGHWAVRFDPTHHMHHSGGGKFDCHAGLTHWEDRWAVEKKHWCWSHFYLGFQEEFDCHLGEAHLWSDGKQNWCCSQKNICHGVHHRSIHHIAHAAFDCAAALGNWAKAWSPAKKSWCWTHEHKGGPPGAPSAPAPLAPPPPPRLPAVSSSWGAAGMLPGMQPSFGALQHGKFNCMAALGNWELAWSTTKKEWCWMHEKKGGPELFNCFAQIPTWSASKRSWCCTHHKESCPERRLSQHPEIFT